jgi:DNA repair exonuclease SbcCD nuclease subunit
MTRLAVLADPHCDDFGSKIDAATGLSARWVDTVAMVRWVANDARERGCDALIVAGDLSESRHPAPWRVAQIGEALDAFDGPTILARGNHDGLRADRSIVDVLAAGRSGWAGFSRPGVSVVGDTAIAVLPYLDKHHLRSLPGYERVPEADIFRVLGEAYLTIARGLFVQACEIGGGAGTVLVVHQALSGGLMSDSQQAFLGDMSLVVDSHALGAIGFDAIVAGHFHLHQVLSEHPLIAYAGSPFRTDFGEALQRKGYLVVDVERDGTTGIVVPSWTFVETPARRFVTLDGDAIEGDVRDAIVRVLNLAPETDTARLRVELEAAGAFEITQMQQRRPDAPEIAGGLSESLGPLEALSAYFADDPDSQLLVALGRELLEAAA